MAAFKTSISSFILVVAAVVFLSMAFSAHAAGRGGGTPQIDIVAEACEKVSRNFNKVHLTKEFCMTALKSDQNKSAGAKDYRHLAFVSASLLRGVVISNAARIEALLPVEKDEGGKLGLRMCRVEYSATPRILQICSDLIKDYVDPDTSGIDYPDQLFRCIDRVDATNKKCNSEISLSDASLKLEKEYEKLALLVNFTTALIEQMTGQKHSGEHI